MKKYSKMTFAGVVLLASLGFSSCTTSYDAYGRPIQTVDPAAAAIGAVAIGAAGYAIGRNNSNDYHYNHHNGHHNGHHRRRH